MTVGKSGGKQQDVELKAGCTSWDVHPCCSCTAQQAATAHDSTPRQLQHSVNELVHVCIAAVGDGQEIQALI